MADGEMAKGRSLREGIVQKRGNVFKKWRFRYLVLTRDTLCIFKKEEDEKRGRTEGRIFVMDIADIDKYNSKKKDFSFYLVAEGRTYYFCCASEIDRELWMRAIKSARSAEYKEEENDPIRRKSMKLTGGLKRITIQKEKGRGLGCTIKCIGGVIFVNRILEDGAVSSSGVLRPGDQLLDINGIDLAGRTIEEVSEIIKSCTDRVICTVKPSTDFRYVDTHKTPDTDYAELDLSSLKARTGSDSSAETHNEERLNRHGHKRGSTSSDTGGTPTNDASQNSPPRYEEPGYDDIVPIDEKRLSLPLPPREPISPKQQEDALNYLELNFHPDRQRERSRVHSEGPPRPTSKKPVLKLVSQEKQPAIEGQNPGTTKEIQNDEEGKATKKYEIPAYAYIELGFNDEMGSGKKPATLPKPSSNLRETQEAQRTGTLPK